MGGPARAGRAGCLGVNPWRSTVVIRLALVEYNRKKGILGLRSWLIPPLLTLSNTLRPQKVVATLKQTMDDAEARIDTMTKVLQCACGTDCVAYKKQQKEWNKTGSIPADARAATAADIGTFEYAHNAPVVVCRGLHIFETEKPKRIMRGLSPGDTPQGTPLPRKPRPVATKADASFAPTAINPTNTLRMANARAPAAQGDAACVASQRSKPRHALHSA